MFVKGQFLQLLGASTCVATTVGGGGYYCFNERKGGNPDSLNASNSEDLESSESFPPIFSFEAHDEKIDLKDKTNNLVSMVTFLNKSIDKLNEDNLSKLKNVQDLSNLENANDFEGLENIGSTDDDSDKEDDEQLEDSKSTETEDDIEFTHFVTQLEDFKDNSDTAVKEAYKQLDDKKNDINTLLEKIRNMSKSSQQKP